MFNLHLYQDINQYKSNSHNSIIFDIYVKESNQIDFV